MAKPPRDADPEKFIIGRGCYSNLQVARPHEDIRVFRIDPAPVPIASIVSCDLLFIAFFYGWHLLVDYITHGREDRWIVNGIPIGLGTLLCGGFSAGVYWAFARANRMGPWLIYDKVSHQVLLPREGVSFERHEVVHLQYITTKRLDCGGVMNNDRLSELNLVTLRNGVRARWPLLRSNLTRKAFDPILNALMRSTDLPVVRVQDTRLGWEVSQGPYPSPRL